MICTRMDVKTNSSGGVSTSGDEDVERGMQANHKSDEEERERKDVKVKRKNSVSSAKMLICRWVNNATDTPVKQLTLTLDCRYRKGGRDTIE